MDIELDPDDLALLRGPDGRKEWVPRVLGHGDFHPHSSAAPHVRRHRLSASPPDTRELPPWGVLDEESFNDIDGMPIPQDWKPLDGSDPDPCDWRAWFGEVVVGIASVLWPVYEPTRAAWTTDAVANLLNADFNLLSRLHPHLNRPIGEQAHTTVTHAEFFEEEDNDKMKFGAGYERYDPKLEQSAREQLPEIMRAALADKVGSLHLQLKNVFQRPRAYQVAFIQGRTDFRHRVARTAGTPSLVSGHCLQASLAGCNAFVELSRSMEPSSIEILEQFTVDIGDRRVFAGVHYPSDNLSSWFTALKLVPHVFGREIAPIVKQFLWRAITKRSTVYKEVRRHATTHADSSPYRPMLEALEKLKPVLGEHER